MLISSRTVAAIAVLLLAAATLSSCQAILAQRGPARIVATGDTLTLSWDADQSAWPGSPSATEHFRVYVRPLGPGSWTFVRATQGFLPRITIHRFELAAGDYEFAVQAVYNNGDRSTLHTSTDYSAWPPGGWYVQWDQP